VDEEWLARRFEAERARLRAVAYRMLGSLAEAEDAVQEAWLRLRRADGVDNVSGWLTTVVARICLDMLRARAVRREEPLRAPLPDPVIGEATDPEGAVLLADSVGLALLVVLDALTPAERLAFVLHDMFAIPYEEIAPVVGRSATAARQLASRARRRVRAAAVPDPDLARQRRAVDAFLAAARGGDLRALVAVLDPDVVVRADVRVAGAARTRTLRGARDVGREAMSFAARADHAWPVLVNGAAGLVVAAPERPIAVLGFTVVRGLIAEIDILADPVRLRRLGPAAFQRPGGAGGPG
jgi:RNA polymerase sigma-70 factor (ECF subfamily)